MLPGFSNKDVQGSINNILFIISWINLEQKALDDLQLCMCYDANAIQYTVIRKTVLKYQIQGVANQL